MAFCNTKGSTERITKFLQMQGIDAECIHGDIPQRKREQVMDKFRRGELRGRCGRSGGRNPDSHRGHRS